MDPLWVWNRRQTSPTIVPHAEKGDNTVHLGIMVEERTLLCVCVSCKWQMMKVSIQQTHRQKEAGHRRETTKQTRRSNPLRDRTSSLEAASEVSG